MEYKALVQTLVRILDSARISYMFVGGIAANYWGLPRATFDVDLVIALQPQDIPRLVRPMKALRFDLREDVVGDILRIGNRFMTRSPTIDYRVDFWIPKTIYEQEAFAHRRRGEVYGKQCWLIAPEDLILMKILAGRGKDREDAIGVIQRQGDRLGWAYLRNWAKQLDVTAALEQLRRKQA